MDAMDALDRYDLDGRTIHVVLAKNKRKTSDEMRQRDDRQDNRGRGGDRAPRGGNDRERPQRSSPSPSPEPRPAREERVCSLLHVSSFLCTLSDSLCGFVLGRATIAKRRRTPKRRETWSFAISGA